MYPLPTFCPPADVRVRNAEIDTSFLNGMASGTRLNHVRDIEVAPDVGQRQLPPALRPTHSCAQRNGNHRLLIAQSFGALDNPAVIVINASAHRPTFFFNLFAQQLASDSAFRRGADCSHTSKALLSADMRRSRRRGTLEGVPVNELNGIPNALRWRLGRSNSATLTRESRDESKLGLFSR
jgi:hypothetical protein